MNSNIVLIIVPYIVPLNDGFAQFIACKDDEIGACIQCSKQIGERNLIQVMPSFVLYINLSGNSGIKVNIIVHGIPITNDVIMACFIFLSTKLYFLL